jgi:hypothetical protein
LQRGQRFRVTGEYLMAGFVADPKNQDLPAAQTNPTTPNPRQSAPLQLAGLARPQDIRISPPA